MTKLDPDWRKKPERGVWLHSELSRGSGGAKAFQVEKGFPLGGQSMSDRENGPGVWKRQREARQYRALEAMLRIFFLTFYFEIR